MILQRDYKVDQRAAVCHKAYTISYGRLKNLKYTA